MYYEQKVVGGVLCSRSSPDGDWRPVTPRDPVIVPPGENRVKQVIRISVRTVLTILKFPIFLLGLSIGFMVESLLAGFDEAEDMFKKKKKVT